MSKRVAFITMGCAKNEADTAHMQKLLIESSYEIVDIEDSFDALVINTCGFIQPAIEENIDVIFEAASLDPIEAGKAKLVVVGCLVSRFGEDLTEELTEPDAFIPCASEDDIVSVLDELFDLQSEQAYEVALPITGPSAYIKISDGCSRSCSYCTIPFIRGPYHSYTLDFVRAEVADVIESGAQEVVFIAQDSGLWGLDLSPRQTLAQMLDVLANEYPQTWFRVMYLQPAGVTTELLEVMATHDNICSYFDIPLQHANKRILSSMNRQGSGAEYLSMIKKIRSYLPDVVLRTTLIVGYPGETEEEFEELCDFVSEADFDYVGIFPYSPEEGTVAAELPDQIEEEIKLERLQELRDIADSISTVRISGRVGTKTDVLVLGWEEDGQLYGRTQGQAPDVDGVTYLEQGEVGQFVPVEIVDTLLYEMEGACVE